jgi:hypothetical protein
MSLPALLSSSLHLADGNATPIASYIREVSIHAKVDKLIRHERSARTLGSTAEADAFAAKVKQLLLDHRIEQRDLSATQHFKGPELGNSQYVHAAEAGLPSRKSRQEWSERLAFASATAFGCELLLQTGSNSVIFRGRKSDRVAAAGLYAELAAKALESCNAVFFLWKRTRVDFAGAHMPAASRSAYSRRWKQSFLLGFSAAVCKRFVCGEDFRIGIPAQEATAVSAGRPIGGVEPLYDAMSRGQAEARSFLAELETPKLEKRGAA